MEQRAFTAGETVYSESNGIGIVMPKDENESTGGYILVRFGDTVRIFQEDGRRDSGDIYSSLHHLEDIPHVCYLVPVVETRKSSLLQKIIQWFKDF